MARRMGKGMNLRIGSEMDAHKMRFLLFVVPWAVWLGAIPLAVLALRMAKRYWQHELLLSVGMMVITTGLSWLVWRVTAMRKGFGRWHPVLNMAGAMGWLTYATWSRELHGLHGVLFLLGGIAGCIAWNVRNATHADPVFDVLADSSLQDKKTKKTKVIDMGYVVRAVAHRAPVVRDVLERSGKAVPALAKPWEVPALESGQESHGGGSGGSQEPLEGKVVGVDPGPVWNKIQANWRKFTTQMESGRQLNGAKLTPVKLSPTRIKAQVHLLPGRQEPDNVTNVKGLIASLNGMPPSSVIPFANPKNNSKVFIDFVIHDTLAQARKWTGPQGSWRSIADAPIIFGQYEDAKPAELFQPAIPSKGKNLTHLAMEGMNGSGKSNVARQAIADAALIYDVVDWVIDPKKGSQTMGCVSSLLEWFATTEPDSVDQIDFVVNLITAKASYLGDLGLDNWEPDCGLPFHRIWIEEGNLVAGILGSSMEDAGNLARSAGVSINGSFQRMHHENVSTGFRAVFSETMSFGVKKSGDAFILPDELAEAGCDPSIWGNDYPGKLYHSRARIPIERKVMEIRSFLVESSLAEEVSREYGEQKMAKVKAMFPDYYELLADIDANGVFRNRQTGQMVREKIDQGRTKREAKKTARAAGASAPSDSGAPSSFGSVASASPVPSPRTPQTLEEEMDMPNQNEVQTDDTEGDEDMRDPRFQEGMKRETTTPGKFSKILTELGARTPWGDDPELEDASLDDMEIPIPHPDEVLRFGEREPDSKAERPRALAFVIAYLAQRGPGWAFQPHDVAEACMEHIGRSASWYRTELSTTIPSLGLTVRDIDNDRWKVTTEIRSERAALKVQEFLGTIETV